MLTLTNRLAMVAGLVRPGKPLADIGTDHAYLPVYLLLQGTIPSAAAADVRQGPLQNAAATVEKYDVEPSVELLLCSGFQHPRLQHYEDFVMAGMGGTLMRDLLEEAPFLQKAGTHLVLQPQSHGEDVRQWLYEHGFSILRETATVDGGRVYIALEAVYDGTVSEYTLADCFLGKLPAATAPERFAHFRQLLKRLTARYEALLPYPEEQEECQMLKDIMTTLETVLEEEPS